MLTCAKRTQAAAPRDTGPVLAPPEPLLPAPGVDERNALAPGMCPICHQARVNPTACVSFQKVNLLVIHARDPFFEKSCNEMLNFCLKSC